MKNFLKISFGLLLIVVLAEIIYYFVILQKTASDQTAKVQPTAVPINIPFLQDTSSSMIADNIFSAASQNFFKSYADFYKAGQLGSLVVTSEYDTSIASVSSIPVKLVSKVDNKTYGFDTSITLKRGENGIYSFYFTKEELTRIKISSAKDNSPLTFTDLKPNDKVRLTISFDLIKNPNENLLNGEIIRL